MKKPAMLKQGVIRKEFLMITRILPIRRPNIITGREARGDCVFTQLAEKVFDHPHLLIILRNKINRWLAIEKSEFTFALAGYICYLGNEYRRAAGYFLKAINAAPYNLDNWFDLAFSLYHQEKNDQESARYILFNFDTLVKYYMGLIKQRKTRPLLTSHNLKRTLKKIVSMAKSQKK